MRILILVLTHAADFKLLESNRRQFRDATDAGHHILLVGEPGERLLLEERWAGIATCVECSPPAGYERLPAKCAGALQLAMSLPWDWLVKLDSDTLILRPLTQFLEETEADAVGAPSTFAPALVAIRAAGPPDLPASALATLGERYLRGFFYAVRRNALRSALPSIVAAAPRFRIVEDALVTAALAAGAARVQFRREIAAERTLQNSSIDPRSPVVNVEDRSDDVWPLFAKRAEALYGKSLESYSWKVVPTRPADRVHTFETRRPLRILHVSSEYPPAKVYGLGRFVHGLARAQAAAGDEVLVLTNSTGGAEDDVVIDGVRLLRIAFPNPPRPPDGQGEVMQFNLCLLARFLDRLDAFREVDVIASHDWLTAIAAREIARILKKPLVVTIHDEVLGKNLGVLNAEARFVRDLEALTVHDATRVIANSAYIAREVTRHYGVPADRVHAIHGGIDPALLDVAAPHRVADFRATLAEPGDIVVLYVGRLDAEKGLPVLAEAALIASRGEPRLRFLFAGTGRDQSLIAKTLEPLGERARLLGYVRGETLAYLYHVADIVVVCSLYEPLGLVALEAMCAGRPVIASKVGGLAEIICDGNDGLLTPPGDANQLAHRMNHLAADRATRQYLGMAARERIRTAFDWSRIAHDTRVVYDRAIAAVRPIPESAPALPRAPLVTVTIVTRDAPHRLERTIRALLSRTAYASIETIIVDTGSAPAALAKLESVVAELHARGHALRLVTSATPRSLTAAHNHAVGLARGEFVCIVGDDVEVPKGSEEWLAGLIWLLEQGDAGTAAPSVSNERQEGIVGLRRTDWNGASCLLTRRRFFEEVGPLGEGLDSADGDEAAREWCLRLTKKRKLSHWIHGVRLDRGTGTSLLDAVPQMTPAGDAIPASIVLVAYNGLAYNRAAIDAILAGTEPPFELVVVDNGSRDGSLELFKSVREQLAARIPVQLIENGENRGYTSAANQGIRAARGRAVVLLNNDTEVRPGWLRALLDAVASGPNVGVVTAKILNLDGSVQNAGGILHRPDGSFEIPHANADRLAPEVSARREVENAGGPCMLLTRALIEKIGMFDEVFNPGYFEDSDLCFRAREAGFTLVYEPAAEVAHHGKATASVVAREGKIAIWRRFEENKRLFYERWKTRIDADEVQRHVRPAPAKSSRRRVFDCFTFFNELDVLEIRLEELDPVVDFFVIVEATRTFSGRPKDLVFPQSRARFARFAEKIVYVVVDDMPVNARSAWEREFHQRNAILRGLRDARPDDLVIISDVDEIPRASAVNAFDGEAAGLEQTSFYYALNCKNQRGQEPRAWSVILRRRHLRSPEETRQRRFELPLIADGGWHFSYLGGADAIRTKIQAFSHQELNTTEFTDPTRIANRMRVGADPFERAGMSWTHVPIDGSFPRCVAETPSRFRHLIREDEDRHLVGSAHGSSSRGNRS